MPTPSRLNRCRYLDRYDNRCTGEVVDPNGEALLCLRHLGLALELLRRKMAK